MTKFTSFYKINGIPIMPPLMTSEKYDEYKKYKEEAIAIENKRNLKSIISNSYDVLSNESVGNRGKCGSSHSFNLQLLEKSDTLIYDVISNTVMIPNEKLSKSNVISLKEVNSKIIEPCQDINISKCDSIKGPLVIVSSPTESNRKELLEKLSQNSVASLPITMSPKKMSLIRSNSFTLEAPSEALANVLLKKKQSETRALKTKATTAREAKVKLPKKNEHISDLVRRKRSPYDSKLTPRNKNLKKHKNLTLKSNKSTHKKMNESAVIEDKSKHFQNLIAEFDRQRKLKFQEMFEKQKEEQFRIETICQNQEKLLLNLFKSSFDINDNSIDKISKSIVN